MVDFKVPGEHIYKGLRLTMNYSTDVLDRVSDFEFRPDDVLIATYPKSGSTWLEQIVWLIKNDVDIETSRQVHIAIRSPCLESKRRAMPANIDTLPDVKSPRVIKTHLPYSFFKQSIEGREQSQFKTIVGMRNVRDLLVAYYNFYKMNARIKFDEDFETFFKLFKEKRLLLGDYFEHVLGWWQSNDNPHVYFVKYEDMKTHPREEISKLAAFLGKALSESQLDAIVNESSFKSMQMNPMTNYESTPVFNMDISKILRKGEVGDWQNYFTAEQLDYVNSRCEEELVPYGLHFQYKVESVAHVTDI